MTPQADFITQRTRDTITWVWGTGLVQQNLAFFAPRTRTDSDFWLARRFHKTGITPGPRVIEMNI
jgi:hypothetical protein